MTSEAPIPLAPQLAASASDESCGLQEETHTRDQIAPLGQAPSVEEAQLALDDIKELLRPRRTTGIGHKAFTAGNDKLQHRMEQIRMLLWFFVRGDSPAWIQASEETASAYEAGPYRARELRKWTRAFISDRHVLPYEHRGAQESVSLLDNEHLKAAIMEHLKGIGKYVRALDIVEFLADPVVQRKYGMEKTIGLSTAQRWMHELDFRWTRTPSGQFVDGHERDDVVTYIRKKF